MSRWTYLIPRLIILGLIALAMWVGSDPLIRRAIVNNLESSIGAQVEIGHLRTSFDKRQLFIEDLVIANPRDPMSNLIQADMAYVEVDTQSLINGCVVIERGQTSQAVFGAPRTNSGALDQDAAPPEVAPTWKPKTFEPIEQIGLRWLDQLPVRSDARPKIEATSIANIASGLNQFWGRELAEQKSNVAALKTRTEELKRLVKPDSTNPLRQKRVNSSLVHSEIATASSSIGQRLVELQQTLEAQRAALRKAFNEDVARINSANPVSKFDSDSITQLLLSKTEERNINEIIGWFHQFRKTMPDPRVDFLPKSKRGLDLKIPLPNKKPGLLIKSIDIEGEGRFANRHTTFAGTAFNLTSQPQLHDQPASFELRAQGDQHVMVKCILDRRGRQSVDSLDIICPDLEIRESQQLGEANSILVTMGPRSRIQADIKLQAIDDQLSGDIIFRHTNVSFHVDELNSLAGGEGAALKINQGLAGLNRFETRVRLFGTLDDYEYELKSDLGIRFSNAVVAVLNEKEEAAVSARKQALDRLLQTQLEILENEITPQLLELENSLRQEATEIADLGSLLPKPDSRLPKIR